MSPCSRLILEVQGADDSEGILVSETPTVDLSDLNGDEVEEVLRESEEGLWTHLAMNADVDEKVLVVSLTNGRYVIRNWWQLAYLVVTRLGARAPEEMTEALGNVSMWLKDEADRQRSSAQQH